MAKMIIPINNFNAGELSLDLTARVDFDKYYSGCRNIKNMVPLVEGGVQRMPGTYYVQPAKDITILTPLQVDFSIFDIATDNTFLYVCGNRYYPGPPADYKSKVIKIKMSDLSLVDSIEYDEGVSGVVESYYGIRYSNGFIYLSGLGISGTKNRAILHCRPVSDLSTLTWSYNYAAAGLDCWFHEPEVDDDFVYAIGNRGTSAVLKVKVDKTTGAQIWQFNNTFSTPVGINHDTNNLYIYKHSGGHNAIEKVLKSDGTVTLYNNLLYDAVQNLGTFIRGCHDGTNIYVCGMSPPGPGLYQNLTMKIKMSDMSWVWSYRTDKMPGAAYETSNKAVQDGTNIYTLGIVNTGDAPFAWDNILEKLDMDGNLVLSKIIMGYSNYAILQWGSYLYLGLYDYDIDPTFSIVERRLKSTLEIG